MQKSSIARASAALLFIFCLMSSAAAQESFAPDHVNVSYAAHPSCTLNFWSARTDHPAPLLVFFHGGGFVGGSKEGISGAVIREARAKGFAVASVGYPFLNTTPIQKILPLSAQAIQFLRAQSASWSIDPTRIAGMGNSAGGGIVLWIGAHPDMADPQASEPIRHQSSRLQAVASINGQATYDILQWDQLIGPWNQSWDKNASERAAFYHLTKAEDLMTPSGESIRAEADMMRLISSSTPPLFLASTQPLAPARNREEHLHHPRHMIVVAEKARALGVKVELITGEEARQAKLPLLALDFFAQVFRVSKP